jgi:1-acyl-sn-glycerol-3-phosphate acyltransferase
MSDETNRNGQQAELPDEPPAPRRRRGRIAEPGPEAEELPIAATGTPTAAPAPSRTPLYSDGGDEGPGLEEIPIGGVAADLYDAELKVRSGAGQTNDQAAAMANMAAGALKLIGDNLRRMTEEQADKVTALLHGIDLKDYLDPNFWRGVGMVLQYQIDEQVSFVKRRLSGEYTTDPYGMDRELIEVARPFLTFMYRTWWRVSATGLEHVPAEGRALLVGNHSGVLPWDGAMIAVAVADEHPAQNERIVRSLHLHWFSTLPFVAPALAALGQVPGLPENAIRLLEDDELVCVFPEGLKGVGKLYKDRYKLARFGRGGFVQAAIRARAPIVPVAVVGAEEIYPMLANADAIARMLGMPYFPITPFFPWLGPLGVIPLPTHWSITFCEPLRTDMYEPAEADDPLTVLGLSEMVRATIQETIDTRLAARTSVF